MSSADSREPDALERETLLAYEAPRAPADMADRVLARLRASVRPRPVWSRWAIAAAAVVAAMAIAALLMLRGGAEPGWSGHRVVDARASIAIGDRAVAVAEAGSEIAWTVRSDGAATVEQRSGDVFYRVTPGQAFVVAVPGARIRVLGTCFRVEVRDMRSRNKILAAGGIGAAVTAAVLVTVYEGRVLLGNEQGEVELAPGERGAADDGAPPVVAESAAAAAVDPITSKSALEARVRELENKLRQAERMLGDGKPAVDSAALADQQFAAETRDPSWAPEREQRIQERLTRFLGIAPGGATVECRRTCCQIDLDMEDRQMVFEELQSDIGLYHLGRGGMAFTTGKEGADRVTQCLPPEELQAGPSRVDRGMEREALLAASRPAVEACMPGAPTAVDFETKMVIDPAGVVLDVKSRTDPVGHPAASCIEEALVAAARFAPSTRVTVIPIHLHLEPPR
jgi:hypothetical protein